MVSFGSLYDDVEFCDAYSDAEIDAAEREAAATARTEPLVTAFDDEDCL